MLQYPSCSAILVKNHGAFYFGASWEETKIMAEIYEVGQILYGVVQPNYMFQYLFKLTLEKIKFAPGMIEQVFFPTGQ